MEQNNGQPQYRGTKGLSLAIVIGAAIGTVIGKLMDNMNTGLMLGLVIGVAAWAPLFNRQQGDPGGADPDAPLRTSAQPDTPPETPAEPDTHSAAEEEKPE